MLTTKQKAYLKSLAQKEKVILQIGKDGLNENLLDNVLNYLTKHELMKISILQNSDVTFEDIEEYFTPNGITFVQGIGRVAVLYKHSDKAKDPIVLPEKK